MQESTLEAELVPAFAAQLRRHIEIERGPFRRQRFGGELAPAQPPRPFGSREVEGGDAKRTVPGDPLDPEDRLRRHSRLPRPATKAQPVSASRDAQPGPAAVEEKARPVAMPERD